MESNMMDTAKNDHVTSAPHSDTLQRVFSCYLLVSGSF